MTADPSTVDPTVGEIYIWLDGGEDFKVEARSGGEAIKDEEKNKSIKALISNQCVEATK
jgi:hypothetical protein